MNSIDGIAIELGMSEIGTLNQIEEGACPPAGGGVDCHAVSFITVPSGERKTKRDLFAYWLHPSGQAAMNGRKGTSGSVGGRLFPYENTKRPIHKEVRPNCIPPPDSPGGRSALAWTVRPGVTDNTTTFE